LTLIAALAGTGCGVNKRSDGLPAGDDAKTTAADVAGDATGDAAAAGDGARGTGGDAGTIGATDAGLDSASCGANCTLLFASGPSWTVTDDDPVTNLAALRLGQAQPVCLNAATPSNCPADAVVYGYGLGSDAWIVDQSMIPGAAWIWGPGTTASAPADLKRFFFSSTFTIARPIRGRISLAADDAAEVRLNGKLLWSVGSITDVAAASAASRTPRTFDLTGGLVPGRNTITVAAQNGPSTFAGCAGSCTYAENPAGVIFGGSIDHL
jgi:hypothetical protein